MSKQPEYVSMDLEDTLASLKIHDHSSPDVNTKEENKSHQPRRSSRLKTEVVSYSEKRRVLTKPVKRPGDENITQNIENYYLDKRIKRLSPCLETIYEDKNEEISISARKLRRAIIFSETSQKIKTKKRKMKAKSVSAKQRVKNKCKVSLDFLLAKLEKVDQ